MSGSCKWLAQTAKKVKWLHNMTNKLFSLYAYIFQGYVFCLVSVFKEEKSYTCDYVKLQF